MKKYIGYLAAGLFILVSVAVMGMLLLSSETEVLYRMQELSLFLPTRMFYATSTIYPGGTLTWMAAYMTQFFHHPTVGVSLLMAVWALIMVLYIRLGKLKGFTIILSALVPLALLACLTQTGYWIYYMKLQGYQWVPTLGVLFSILAALVYRCIPNKKGLPLIWMTIWGIAGYPLMGTWSFLGTGLMMIPVKLEKENMWLRIIAPIALGMLLILAVPPIACQLFYCQVQPDYIYSAALPSYQYGKLNATEYHTTYYALLLAFLPTLLMWVDRPINKWLTGLASVLCLAGAAWGVNVKWYRDTNFYKEVAMANCIEKLDWEGVLRVMLDKTMGENMPPTRVMVMEKNLALFRLGRAGDEMFHYPEGAEQQHSVIPVKITQVGGKLLYYNYGKADFCYRWCMEDGVEFGWSVNVLKYMTKTSIVNNDLGVARKYIDLLKKTRYHREWAEHWETFIDHPELMEKDEELIPILPMSQFTDRLDGDNTLVEMYLLSTFANGQGADRYYQENTLICAMIMKDIELFWPRFHRYINMHQSDEGFRVPTHYQEAAYLYCMLEPNRISELWPPLTNAEAAQRIPFDQEVKKKYEDFMNFNTQCGSMTDEQKKVAFYPQFGDTFYYFYFLVRDQKTN